MNSDSFSKEFFVSEPYSECPICKNNSFGLALMGVSATKYKKECFRCEHHEFYTLPKLKKKIIYLDQFAIDKMVKTLDKTHPKHALIVAAEPFWLDIYKMLDKLSKAQLIVCPDSFYHLEESAPTNYFDSMQRIYESLSGGVTFYRAEWIIKSQILEHFKNYLNGKSDIPPSLGVDGVVFGDIHAWHNKMMRISIDGSKKEQEIKDIQEKTKNTHMRFLAVFERWKKEKRKPFIDYYREEMAGYARGTMYAVDNFYKRKDALLKKAEQTGNIGDLNVNDFFPPTSVELFEEMCSTAMSLGECNENESVKKVVEYLANIENLDMIPTLRTGTSIYAKIAFDASNGRKPPTQGFKVDIDMISGFMPYCNAMLIDKEFLNILKTTVVAKKINLETKLFATKDKDDFLIYLSSLFDSADSDHMKFIEEMYGKDQIEPYTTILEDK